MAAGLPVLGPAAALAFGVYADLAFNLFSAMNSSPQTTELFADDRGDTLWKYVKIADVVGWQDWRNDPDNGLLSDAAKIRALIDGAMGGERM